MSTRSRIALLAAIASTTLLSACVEPTAYRPATGQGFARAGYSEDRIEENRFMVNFAGNSYTDRSTVERYLLYRSAELTVQSGYDNFTLVNRDTDKQTRTYVDQPFGGGPFGYWGPSWRYYGAGYGWRGWNPWYGDPFWDRQIDVRTVERYEASAEIVLGKGPVAKGNVRGFDARSVLQNLGPSIISPK